MKEDSTKDLRSIFSGLVDVEFSKKGVKEVVRSRWCLICKDNKNFVATKGLRCTFFKGHNSTCRTHICGHWDIYKAKCEDGGIPINHRCISRNVLKEMEVKKLQEKEKKKQSVLDGVIVKVNRPKEFSKTGTTHAVAQLVACDDQHTWGGREEQLKEIEDGNPFAKNWQDEALQVIESEMSKYYKTPHPNSSTDDTNLTALTSSTL
ncbi:hypothetical protein H0H92_008736 [Tricholoma furcatifolium]|nr:hypothetical protein H0H92_008736 [Tricholoma furcatifolium]